MSNYWHEYVKAAYDLILESENICNVFLEHEVEAYVVHLFAQNFERTDIGSEAIAIKMLTEMQKTKKQANYKLIGDECLLIDSFPLRKKKWPSSTYYHDMGCIAYGMADITIMEQNFKAASKVLSSMFTRLNTNYLT